MDIQFDDDYKKWLASVKTDFRRSQIKAATKANSELVAFNWRLGRSICLMRAEAKWGNGFFNTLSQDLKELLPESKGFSTKNLRYMERFYRLFPDRFRPQAEDEIIGMLNVPQLGGQMKGLTNVPQVGEEILPQVGAEIFMIPWNHVKYIIDKCDDDSQKALFYIRETIKNNWSRAILLNFLGTDLYERKGKAVTNFSSTIPEYKGDLAAEITKDPYSFDFLGLREKYNEASLKNFLIGDIERFLVELGSGFAYMGREYRVQIGNKEEFIDLLFYNTRIHAYVVIEVKIHEFEPRDVGQVGTYVVAIDHLLKTERDEKTIGLLICKEKDEILARYALESCSQPLGISSYELMRHLPKEFHSTLPTVEEIENKLNHKDD